MDFVDAMKASMGYTQTRKLSKGVGSNDISTYLYELRKKYAEQGRDVKYIWKKLGRTHNCNHRGFRGQHVEELLKAAEGTRFMLFGAAKKNTQDHKGFMAKLGKAGREGEQFAMYAERALGTMRSDHAIGLRVGVDCLIFDNALKALKSFSVEALADRMRDICNVFVIDICEV